jgi:hypothetical protein
MSGRATKVRKTGGKAASSVSDERIKTLVSLNDLVEQAHNNNDLLRRLITDTRGTDLQALVGRIRTHICDIAEKYLRHQQEVAASNEQQQRLAASFAQKQLSEDDINSLRHLFDDLCGLTAKANDDKARIAQLASVLAVLFVDFEVRNQLVLPNRQQERFPLLGSEPETAVDVNDRKFANLIDKSALTMYLAHDARQLISAQRDGLLTMNEYIDKAVAAYMSYMPSLTPRIARTYRDLLAAAENKNDK